MTVIGSRKSPLAMAQTEQVRGILKKAFPDEEFMIKGISTAGDKDKKSPLNKFSSKGIFLKELEEELLSGKIDMAVHSAKDVPTELPKGLEIGAVIMRTDARDMLISPYEVLPDRPIMGTGSIRREVQIKELYPDCVIKPIRGNINTRIEKLKSGLYDAVVMARAAYERMNKELFDGLYTHTIPIDKMVPAPGQGMLCVEVRKGDMQKYMGVLNDESAYKLLKEERDFLEEIGGGCHTPSGAYAEIKNSEITIHTMYERNGVIIKRSLSGADCGKRAAKLCRGMVYIAGAGIGSADLASERTINIIKKADAVVYDNLISPTLLSYANDRCELLYAGKRAGQHHMEQDKINALLINLAENGKIAVRLKGGDPFIFGRGSEEAQALEKAGISYEVIPGISSSYAAAECAGIPVTHRGISSSVHIITGHVGKGSKETDYEVLERLGGTLVFLMGLSRINEITSGLVNAGMDKNTPCAVISQGGTPMQKCIRGTIKDIAIRVKEQKIQSPAVIAVGKVTELEYSCQRSNQNRGRAVLTGSRTVNKNVKKDFDALGISTEEISLIRTERINAEQLDNLDLTAFSHIVLTSQNGADILFDSLKNRRTDIRSLGKIRFAAVGERTKSALEKYGIYADIVPEQNNSGALLDKILSDDIKNALILKSEQGRHIIENGFLEKNIKHTVLNIYKTVYEERNRELLNLTVNDEDCIVFMSPSAVRAYCDMYEGEKKPMIAVIGETTLKAAKDAGICVSAVAQTADGEGLAKAVRDLFYPMRKGLI